MRTYRDYTITPEEVEMLRDVRRYQKAFFEDKDKSVVGRSKAAERAMDKFLMQFPDPQNSTEPDLFDTERTYANGQAA